MVTGHNVTLHSCSWIIGGDFNVHSPFGKKKHCPTTSNNRFVENVVVASLVPLNDGSMTRIPDVANHVRSTAIDFSLGSPQLFPDCSWDTFEEPGAVIIYQSLSSSVIARMFMKHQVIQLIILIMTVLTVLGHVQWSSDGVWHRLIRKW